MSFLNHLISGISLGSIYAIIALGYTMVYGIAKMLNFAHGDVIMVGGYKMCIRDSGMFDYLRPDGKSQVTVEYDEDNQPVRVDTVVISTQHSPEVSLAQIREDMIEQVVKKVIPSHLLDENTKYFINPTGRFVIGGPHGDSGLTGRKIIVDTYGGIGHHGGGAFSGKDPTKVDRSGAYAARWVAKNIVAAGLAKRCEIQLAYAIGVAEPVSIMVETFGTGVVGDDVLEKVVEKVFDLRPAAIIEQLDPVSYTHLLRDWRP